MGSAPPERYVHPHADRRLPSPGLAPRNTSVGHDPGVYLTDGLRLFRVVGTLTPNNGPCVHMEDCYTLSEDLYTAHELWEMQLRTVGYRIPIPA